MMELMRRWWVAPLVTYTEGIPEFLQTVRIHSVYVKEAAHSFESPAVSSLQMIQRFIDISLK